MAQGKSHLLPSLTTRVSHPGPLKLTLAPGCTSSQGLESSLVEAWSRWKQQGWSGGCGTHRVSALASVADSVLPGLPAEGPSMENTVHTLSGVFSQSLMEGPGEDFGSNSSSMEVESRGYGVRSHPKLPREFEAASATLDGGPGLRQPRLR